MAAPTAVASFRDLLIDLQNNVVLKADSDLLAAQLSKARPALAQPLQQRGPDAEAREQIKTGHPELPGGQGRVLLDQEPDIREVLLMSDVLRVHEMDCLLCLLSGHEERGEVSAEVAAGVFYQERRALLTALKLLLSLAAAGSAAAEDESGVTAVVCHFVGDLLAERTDGRSALVSRLLDLLKESLAAEAVRNQSLLSNVVDDHGATAPLATVTARERTLLVENLAMAVILAPRSVAIADIVSAADAARALAAQCSALETSGGDVITAQHQTYVATVAALATLLPMENAEGEECDKDETALATLAADATLSAKLEGASAAGPAAVLRLAWGLLQAQSGPTSAQDGAAIAIASATASGALTWLSEGFLGSVPFGDEDNEAKAQYATAAHQLLMMLLDAPPGREEVEHLTAASLARSEAAAKPGQAGDTASPQADDLVALLRALAAVYQAHPQLWLDPELRYPILGDFMGHVAAGDAVNSAPPVFCAYMDVLTALAADANGAQAMYAQLRPANAVSSMVSWRRMFDFLLQICQLYSDMEADTRGVGLDVVIQRDLHVLSDSDTSAVLAYLRLFSAVMRHGGSASAGWLQQLEAETGVAPLWEALFQLAAHPVPQEAKGAAWMAIAACVHTPAAAAAAWERLLQESVLAQAGRSGSMDAQVAIPQYDMTYQLNEIEARAEDYTETLAFVRLLNVLATVGSEGAASVEGGRPAAAFARHVRRDVLAAIHQRAHKCATQKWEVIAAAVEHLRLTLRRVAAEGEQPLRFLQGGGLDTSLMPATEILLDLLGSQGAMRAIVAALGGGVQALAEARAGAPEGAAREAAVLECLRLLRTAFSVDMQLVHRLRAAEAGLFSTLDEVIAADPPLVAQLLGFVRYTHNPAIQLEGLRISAVLSARVPDLLQLLATAGAATSDLIDGFARCLDDALSPTGAYIPLDDASPSAAAAAAAAADAAGSPPTHSDLEGADPRVGAVLGLLWDGLASGPIPGLAHLLLGYQVGDGVIGVNQTVLDTRAQLSCLSVILRTVSDPPQHASQPHQQGAFEAMLRLLAALAGGEATSEPLLHLLRSQYDSLALLVPAVVCTPLPDQDAARTVALQQKAAALKLYALQLHKAVPAVPLHRTSTVSLLTALFGRAASEDAAAPPQNAMLLLLEEVTSAVETPELSTASTPQVRRAQQALGIMELLGAGTLVSAGGVRILDPSSSRLLFDVEALMTVLRDRYNTAAAQGSVASAATMQDACRQALQFAQRFNAFAVSHATSTDLLHSWQAVVEVAFSERFKQLHSAVQSATGLLPGTTDGKDGDSSSGTCDWPEGSLGLLLSVVEASLTAAKQLASGATQLAGPLCEAVRTLLAVVRARAAAGLLLSDPPTQVEESDDDAMDYDGFGDRVARRLLAAATAMVKVAMGGRRPEVIRLPLHGALLNLVALAGSGAHAALSPATVSAVMDGNRQTAGVSLDGLRASLEEGLPACFASNGKALVESLASDALPGGSSGLAGRTTALTLLAALVAAEGRSGEAAAAHLYATGLPAHILMDLAAADDSMLSSQKGLPALLEVEAALRLLLRLAVIQSPRERSSQGRPAAAHRLFALNAIPRLAQCRLVDVEWEAVTASSGSGTRERILQVVSPALQVVLAVAGQLPDSSAARGQVSQFVEAHTSLLTRLMDDAADGRRMEGAVVPAISTAQLAVAVVCHVMPAVRASAVWGLLQPPLFRLAWLYGRLNSRVRDPILSEMLQFHSSFIPHDPPPFLVPYDEAAARDAHGNGDSGGKSPAQKTAEEVQLGVRRLRLAVIQALRLLSADIDSRGPTAQNSKTQQVQPMSWGCVPHASAAQVSHRPPTLPLLRETLSQATEDLQNALDDRQQVLQGRTGAEGSGDTVGLALAVAASVESRVADQVLMVENLLAIFLAVLRRPQPGGIASERDLDQLRRLMEAPLDALIRLPNDSTFSEDVESLRMLARAVKGLVMQL